MFGKILFVLFIFVLFSNICFSDNIGKALMLLSAYQQGKVAFGGVDREIALGHEIRDLYLKEMKLIDDPVTWLWVENIFKRIVEHTSRKELSYEFFLVENEQVNAFALPGGAIFIFSGLLDYVDSDDELAGVIAHELVHIEKKHALKLLRDNVVLGPLINLGVGGIDKNKASLMLQLSSLQYQRDMELEADGSGIDMCSKAGYDPKGMERFLYKLSSKDSVDMNSLQRLLRTHPVSGVRVQQASWKIDEISQNYDPVILSKPKNIKNNVLYFNSFEKKNEIDRLNINCEKAFIQDNFKHDGLYALKCISQDSFIRIKTPYIEKGKEKKIQCSFFINPLKNKVQNIVLGVECYSKDKVIIKYINEKQEISAEFSKWLEVKKIFDNIPEKTEYMCFTVSVTDVSEFIIDSMYVEKIAEKKDETLERSENIIFSEDFEVDKNNDKFPDDWSLKNARLVSHESFSSVLCVKLGENESEYSYLISPKFNVSGSDRYVVSFWAKTDESADIEVLTTFYNKEDKQIFIPGSYDKKISVHRYWFKKAFYLDFSNISGNLDFYCRLKFKLNSAKVYIDDIKVTVSPLDHRERSRSIRYNIWNEEKGKIEDK